MIESNQPPLQLKESQFPNLPLRVRLLLVGPRALRWRHHLPAAAEAPDVYAAALHPHDPLQHRADPHGKTYHALLLRHQLEPDYHQAPAPPGERAGDWSEPRGVFNV